MSTMAKVAKGLGFSYEALSDMSLEELNAWVRLC